MLRVELLLWAIFLCRLFRSDAVSLSPRFSQLFVLLLNAVQAVGIAPSASAGHFNVDAAAFQFCVVLPEGKLTKHRHR